MSQTKLAARASELRRRIYASLPLEIRVAHLAVRLKLGVDFVTKNIGRMMYAEFIRAGVVGMEPVRGKPALELRDAVKKKGMNAFALLPSSYGARFGDKLRQVVSRYVKNQDAINDVLQNVALEFYKRNAKGQGDSKAAIREGSSVGEAESHTVWLAGRRAQDWVKKPEHHQRSLHDPETGRMPDLVDPGVIRSLVKLFSRSDLNNFKRDLGQIDKENPSRPWQLIEGVLEGKSFADVARDWGVNRSVPTVLFKRWLPDLRAIFEKYIETDYASYAESY